MLLMASRMERYDNSLRNVSSRTAKNQQLYKELYSNKTYTEFMDIENDNVVELNSNEELFNNTRRSNLNRNRVIYSNGTNQVQRRSDLGINSSYQKILEEDKEKTYNINDIMEMARRNRTELDENEKKLKIRSAEYSILSDLSQEKLKEYQERKEKGLSKDEEENLEELIHTITSQSLRKKIDDHLLTDLLADEDSDTFVSKKLLDEIENGSNDEIDDDDTKEQSENTDSIEKGLDTSFYTRSMDLKKEDLIMPSDENEETDLSFEDEKEGPLKVIVTIVLVLLVLAIVGYVFYKYLLVK